jgi:ATP-binding cassette subfamily B protein
MKYYDLDNQTEQKEGYLKNAKKSFQQFSQYIAEDKRKIPFVFLLILLNSAAGIMTPYFVALGIDRYIAAGNLGGLGKTILLLIGIYLITALIGYNQTKIIGGISQRTLFRLRGSIFEKLQSLPIAFFHQNKAGDLISRINNDTDKLSQLLSETVPQFAGNFFVLFGIGVFVFFLNWKLAIVLLISTLVVTVITRILSPIIEKLNKKSSAALGHLSSGIQESLSNFKVIVAFNRRNYFEESLRKNNEKNYKASVKTGFANRILEPIYEFAGNTSQLLVLIFGIYFISQGQLTIGLLIGFLAYSQRFYDPMRYIAALMGNIQTSLASWSRIRNILKLESHLRVLPAAGTANGAPANSAHSDWLLEFRDVSFGYEDSQHVLDHVSFHLEKNKTYALVGPTGGGKTTMAGLMVRLHDPVEGTIYFKGRDIRTYSPAELGESIGVILQDPFLFSGTVGENIRYGNHDLDTMSDEDLRMSMEKKGLLHLLDRFEDGLKSTVNDTAENISLGQKQLISFIRILLREPELLIMDEATANIDTVTEQILTDIIAKLPKETTKVIIAHRLNTIREADEILFVNGGKAERTTDFEDALKKIHASKRLS